MNTPAGCYQYVKINRWNDRKIDVGQALFMRDPKTFEVTTHGELPYCLGVSLQSHRYHLWEYALWILTRSPRFSPVRYVFIQRLVYYHLEESNVFSLDHGFETEGDEKK
jgi:hypothetical protein